MTKSDLRNLYLEKRRGLSVDEQAYLNSQLTEQFFAEIDFAEIRCIHCFISMEHTGEVETKQIFEKLWREFPHITTFAPRVNEATNEIDALPFTSESKTVLSKWRIAEPMHDEIVDPQKIDLVIVPLLCFDNRGFRVGYGKGFYDKFLMKCRPDCCKIGLSFFPPGEQIDDVHDGDISLDCCVTPEYFYRKDTKTQRMVQHV